MSSAPAATGVRELLVDLVSIPSVSGDEDQAVQWLVERVADLGYEASIDGAGNAVGTRGDGPHEIMLLGHIDTVPGEVPVRVEGDLLYGRGAVDAKGPLATFVVAGAKAELPDGVRLTVVGAVGEESFGSPGASWLRDHHPAPDALIIGEPSGWDGVVLGYKGAISLKARVERGLTHSAGPELTAPELIFCFWRAVLGWLAEVNGETAPGFKSLDGALRGFDSGGDGLREWATAGMTFRLPPGIESCAVQERVGQIAGQFDVTLEWALNAEAYRVERTSPLVAPFLAAIRAGGGKPRLKVKTGTSDMNIVGPVWGCPAVAYGPGDASYDHTPDEQVRLCEVERAVEILTEAIERHAAALAGDRGTVEKGSRSS